MWLHTARLVPNDPQESGSFARSVAVDGDTIAARQRGNAYVFVRSGNTWTQQARLVPPHPDESSEETIALDGDNLVIGRPQDSAFTLSYSHGTAWIYHRSGSLWALEGSAGGLPVGQVGKDVGIAGDTAIVMGSLMKDSINVRRRVGTSWNVVQSINCCPGPYGYLRSMAMDATTLVFATQGLSQGGFTGNSVHFYRFDGTAWGYQQSLMPPGTDPSGQFGIDTALSGDRLAVGVPFDDAYGLDVGSVFTFVRVDDTWRAETVIGPCDANVYTFGESVALDGTTLVVSAKQYMDTRLPAGFRSVAYVFERTSNGWEPRQRLTIPNPPVNNELGISLAVDEQRIIIGSMSDDDPAPNCGALHVFERREAIGTNFCFGDGSGTLCPCSNPGLPGNGCANAFTTAGARLDANGSASIADDRLLLSCRGVTPGTSAFFLQGDAREQSGFGVPYRDGLRCITGTLVSLGAASSCDGNATFPTAHEPSLSVLGSIPPVGATRYYQVRYASPGPCGTGTNFTNAVAIAWAP